jgi:hypothetical protein
MIQFARGVAPKRSWHLVQFLNRLFVRQVNYLI